MAQDWPDKLITELCNALKEKRLSLGASIYRVSQSSGVSQQAISNYEKLNRRPTLECLLKVSLALGLKPSKLLELVEKRVGVPAIAPEASSKPKRTPKTKG